MNKDLANDGFVVYFYRWLILVLFIFAGFANALVLLTFAPISDKADEFWNGIGLTAVNLLCIIFQICYIPGTTLALYISKHYNLYWIMVGGCSLTIVGCIIRYIGAISRENGSLDPVSSYVIVLLGTIFVALAQPFYLNMPARIGSAWFAVKERDFAMTLCSLANPLGSAVGSVIPAFLVSGGGANDDGPVSGVSNLLLVQMVISLVATGLTVLFFRTRPLTPPSNSASQQDSLHQQQQKQNQSLTASTGTTEVPLLQDSSNPPERNMLRSFQLLLANPDYCKLFFSFSISLGHLNAVAALLNQLPGGYENQQVGYTGFALILSGFLGAFITGIVLDKTKAYRSILKGTYISAVLAWILFLSSCRTGNFSFFIASAALLGLSLLPTIPSTIVNAVECAYPLPDDLSVGLLYIGANTLAIALTFIGQVLLASSASSTGPEPFFPYWIWVVVSMVIVLIPILLFQGSYHRSAQDLTQTLLDTTDDQA